MLYISFLRNKLPLAISYKKSARAMSTSITCLNVASEANSASIIFGSEKSKTIVNVPEGAQRLCIEYKVTMKN